MFKRVGKSSKLKKLRGYLAGDRFQIQIIGIATVILAFIIVLSGATPKKYKLELGDKSPYDITAPRDIINKTKAEEKAKAAMDAVQPLLKQDDTAIFEVFVSIDKFITMINSARTKVKDSIDALNLESGSEAYKNALALEQQKATKDLMEGIQKEGIPLSEEEANYLIAKASDKDINDFKSITMDMVNLIMQEEITEENIPNVIVKAQNDFQQLGINQNLKNIGSQLIKSILKPTKTIDQVLTDKLKRDAYNEAYEEAAKVDKILEGERIISFGEIVTQDKLNILQELNLLETTSRPDFIFAIGILFVLILMASLLILFMKHFCNTVLRNKNSILMLSLIVLMTLLLARVVYSYISSLAIPFFIGTMLISILVDLKLAMAVNFILAITISFIARGDMRFLYIALVSGSFSAFLASKAKQRSKLSMAGIAIGLISSFIVVCLGIINKGDVKDIVKDSLVVLANGVISMIATIGMLPIWESTFNIITPLKLLELTDPNQPLLKKLLMEAPGTYHHSLMVGNLAEVATESIGGNALLARVGAYFHDVGKLTRPHFFRENQYNDNPHDRMTPNLSTLVITSHTKDGVELAEKYKIPAVIRNIIAEHHGTTLVAYFYHKAKNGEKGQEVKQEDFRYQGPRPNSKEAAVVMLADSVEAAVRAMPEKTEGKIEGLIRKIIKEKLDDGQLDLCDLTLKDLETISKSFVKVLTGLYHEREQYPEVKLKAEGIEDPLYMNDKINNTKVTTDTDKTDTDKNSKSDTNNNKHNDVKEDTAKKKRKESD